MKTTRKRILLGSSKSVTWEPGVRYGYKGVRGMTMSIAKVLVVFWHGCNM